METAPGFQGGVTGAAEDGTGLGLSRRYYEEFGRPMLRRSFPALLDQIAVGRVGEGSECFGFDDALSRDHDFGPGFCLWLEEPLWREYGAALCAAYWALPVECAGVRRPERGPFLQRVGPSSIPGFYARFLGTAGYPETERQWFALPQEVLALCTNGAVFCDPAGGFTARRTHLLNYYPEPVRLKKLAAHCAIAAQAGQYNYTRCLRRGERSAALWALSRFQYHLMAAVFLLERRYMPYGKWAPRALRRLPALGWKLAPLLEAMDLERPDTPRGIEEACALLAGELFRQGLSDSRDPFLTAQGAAVQARITHPEFAALPLLSWRSGWQI